MTERGWTDMFGALQEREFDRLLTGQVVSTTGEAMIPVALAFAVLDMTESPTDVGVVLAAGVVPVVLFLLLGGVWADRLPHRCQKLLPEPQTVLLRAAVIIGPAVRPRREKLLHQEAVRPHQLHSIQPRILHPNRARGERIDDLPDLIPIDLVSRFNVEIGRYWPH